MSAVKVKNNRFEWIRIDSDRYLKRDGRLILMASTESGGQVGERTRISCQRRNKYMEGIRLRVSPYWASALSTLDNKAVTLKNNVTILGRTK